MKRTSRRPKRSSKRNPPEKLDLSTMGVVVHPKADWPGPVHPRWVKESVLKPDNQLHTTQRYVYADHVADKVKQIQDGEGPKVSYVKLGGTRWVFDGHHALAAYLLLGLPPKVYFYDNGGYDRIAAPKLYTRK